MFEHILDFFEKVIGTYIGSGGYLAVVSLMAATSACIPIPSEIIMPLAGIAAAKGQLGFVGVVIAGIIGEAIGGSLAYWAGRRGGRPFIEKYGKYFLVKKKEIEHADSWFSRWGRPAVFFGRLTPLIRTFMALPAGIYQMPYAPFLALSSAASLIWCTALALLGYKFEEHREQLKGYFHYVDYIIVAAVVGLVIYWVVKKRREPEAS